MRGTLRPMRPTPNPLVRRDHLALLLVAVAAVLAHGASLSCGWIWDDDSYITANRVVSSPNGFVDAFIPGLTPQYYPLVFAGFWAQHAISGVEPFAYHLVNVLMHAANAVLLCIVGRRLAIPHSAWIALVFAVHPMGVESVAWVTERKNVQSMLFALASVWFFLQHLEAEPRRRAGTWIASFALYACALLSKTTAIFVPPCLVMIALWQRRTIDRAFVMRALPFFALGIVLGLHTAHVEQTVVGARGTDFDPTLLERLQLAPRVALFYLGSFFVPREQVFIYPQLRIDARDAMLWAPLALSLVAAWRCVVHWRRGTRAPLLVYLWIGAALFPALGFIDVWPFRYSVVADHFAYAALPAFALVLVSAVHAGFDRFARKRSHAPAALLGVFALASVVLSVRATAKYESEEALWMKTREQNPAAWIAHNNLATIRLREAESALAAGDGNAVRAKAGEAADLATEAAALKPDEFTNAVNASEALRLLGDNEGALKAIDRAVALAPHIAENHWLRARVLEALGRTDEARDALLRSAEAGAGSFDELAARRDLMRLAAAGGDNAAALVQCRRIVELAPSDTDMVANLGALLVATGDAEQGRKTLLKALSMHEDGFVFRTPQPWFATASRYLALAAERRLDAEEDRAAKLVAMRLVTRSNGDMGARFLEAAQRLAQGDESARPALVRMEADARNAGAAEFADRIAAFLAARPAKP